MDIGGLLELVFTLAGFLGQDVVFVALIAPYFATSLDFKSLGSRFFSFYLVSHFNSRQINESLWYHFPSR
jgi:hypothetical protein